MKKIYLDHAGTTPVDGDVNKKLKPILEEVFGNPSSIHSFGQEALFVVDNARKTVAEFLGALESEVLFTPSATIANNMAILGLLEDGDHIITSSFEHKAVLETVKNAKGEATYLPVYENGVVKVEDVARSIKENTRLVSVCYVNSEVGTIQPIKEIGEVIKKENEKRKNKIIFHTDAVQAVNYLNCKVDDLGVDMLTLSGHKIYGPKGAGALYVRKGVKLKPLFYGASQESGFVPGTENVFAIAGLGFAIEELKKNKKEELEALRNKTIDTILKEIPNTKLNGDREKRIANNINITFSGVEGEGLMFLLDREGIAVSTGSACASKSLLPSYVLLAMGLSHEEAHSSLRISLGRMTTEEDLDYFIEKLKEAVNKLRKVSGR
jgi:cysteine desulfurase